MHPGRASDEEVPERDLVAEPQGRLGGREENDAGKDGAERARAPGEKGPAGAGSRDEEERDDGERVADADIHVRHAGRGEVGASEDRGQGRSRHDETPEARAADETGRSRAEGRERRESGRRRELDREGDGEVEEKPGPAHLAEEVVEALARPRDSLHEKQAGSVPRDPLREGTREREDRALLRKA